MSTDISSQLDSFVRAYLLPLGWKLLGALAVWTIGLVIVSIVRSGSRRVMAARRLDATLATYLDASLGVLLKLLLLIAVFSVLGVETTSFAALLAAAGIAIGAAWSGLLANFAAGLFLLFLRPFKVGDAVEVGGVVGTVQEIGLFTTAIDSLDNVRVSVGNNRIFADSIRNFSINPYRLAQGKVPIPYGVDPIAMMSRLSGRVGTIANVLSQPSPAAVILEFGVTGPVLAVRAFCDNRHFLQVSADINRLVGEVTNEVGFTIRSVNDVIRGELAKRAD
jgi:small conductance mechanosensitive channel